MSDTVVLFPGQGSAPRDMRAVVERDAPELAALTIAIAGDDVFANADATMSAMQPAFVATILSGWHRLLRLVDQGHFGWGDDADGPLAFAGHSLGELPALAAAGAIDEADALRVAFARGTLMEEARQGPAGGRMVAVIGPSARAVTDELLASASGALVLANDNSPEQVIISGSIETIATATAAAVAAGLRAVPMPMEAAGHSPGMRAMIDDYRAVLEEVTFRPTTVDVYSSATARPFTDPVSELAEAVARPVRWREVLLDLHARGARRFVDTGPGHVVAGLASKTLKDVQTPTVTDLERTLA